MSEEPFTEYTVKGLEIARQWAKLPPSHLGKALAALEPEMNREHQYRMKCKAQQHEALMAGFAERQQRRTYQLHLAGMSAGFVLSMTMLVGAIIVGSNGQVLLAALLSGPSVVALATLFVLRRSDSASVRESGKAIRGLAP